jgi:hypothetical protein
MAVARAFFESLRTLSFSGITGTYAPVQGPLTQMVRAFCITNNTDGDLIFSLDQNNVAGHMFVAKGSYKLYDVQANMNAQKDDKYVLAINDQFYVKYVTAPTNGDVYIELMY